MYKYMNRILLVAMFSFIYGSISAKWGEVIPCDVTTIDWKFVWGTITVFFIPLFIAFLAGRESNGTA